jgi:hypothetical protein
MLSASAAGASASMLLLMPYAGAGLYPASLFLVHTTGLM